MTAVDTTARLESHKRSIFVCVGDLSADKHASRLYGTLRELLPDVALWGMGSSAMQDAGIEILYNCQRTSVIGIFEPIKLIPYLAKVRGNLLDEIERRQPEIALLMDYGGFNLGLAQVIHKRFPKLPIAYMISPQVWGSRPWRIQVIKRCVKKMLVIFPFEETLYRENGIDATFIGHPLSMRFSGPLDCLSKDELCAKYGFTTDKPLVGILPGSRNNEIKEHLTVVLEAVRWMARARPDVQFGLSQANSHIGEAIGGYFANPRWSSLLERNLKLISPDDSLSLMQSSDLLWAKSGTTTLEAALMEKPMINFYRGSWLSFPIFLCFKTVKYATWPNLLAGYGLVPELIQLDCRSERLVKYTCDWLDTPGKLAEVKQGLSQIKSHLGHGDFTANAAREIAAFVTAQKGGAGKILVESPTVGNCPE